MGKTIGAVWRIEWHDPYSEPPDGQPREIYRKYVKYGSPDYNQCPPDILEKWVAGKWSICWSAIREPMKSMSTEGKASIRKRNLRKRMEKKYPLFAEEFIQEEMKARPKYFMGLNNPEAIKARQEVLDNKRRVYEKFKEAIQK